MERLKVYIRKHQPLDENYNKVRYEGTNPSDLRIVPGEVDNNVYFEVTKDMLIEDPIIFSFKVRNNDGGKGTSGIEMGSTSEISFIGDTAKFIQDWLLDSVSAHLNAIEFTFEDTDSGTKYSDWIIYNRGIKNCSDDEGCLMKVNLRQQDELYECIQRTSITDNHQGWFQKDTTKHVLFDYCNEFRPTALLSVILFTFSIQYFTMFIILAPIIFIIQTIVGALNAIIRFLGGRPINNPITFNNIIELYHKMIRLVAGCGRRYVGVLARDYVVNVCSKCGIQVNKDSFPILFDPNSPYYNSVEISNPVKGGLGELKPVPDRWQPDNDPLLFLDQYLDDLKETYNAKWFIKKGILYFKRKDEVNSNIIFNFENEDKKYLIDKPCFTWNEQVSPAFARYEWGMDSQDNVSRDAYSRFSTLVEFNKPRNPAFKGELRKQLTKYASTRFRLDGVNPDYIDEALAPLKTLATFSLVMLPIYNQIKQSLVGLTGCIIVQNDVLSLRKTLVWDGLNPDHARAKYIYSYGGLMPPPNPVYNPQGASYLSFHSSDITFEQFENKATRLYNYDFAFEEMFLNNLYDRFHQIDDPRLKISFYKNWDLTVPNCEEILKRLGLAENATDILLENKVFLNAGRFFKEGVIEEITIEYYSNSANGDLITMKGRI